MAVITQHHSNSSKLQFAEISTAAMHMIVTGSNTALYHTVNDDGTLAYMVSQSVAYLLYPLLGWLADVYFSRYKLVLVSFITMMVATILMIITVSIFMSFPKTRTFYISRGLSLLISLIGFELFESHWA